MVDPAIAPSRKTDPQQHNTKTEIKIKDEITKKIPIQRPKEIAKSSGRPILVFVTVRCHLEY